MEAVQQQKKYMWECPECKSRFFAEPITLGVRNGQLVRIPPICNRCFKACACGQRQPYGECCQVCGDPRTRVSLIRHEVDPDDPTFGLTSTGSTTYPTSTDASGGAAASPPMDVGYAVADALTISAIGTISSIGVNWHGITAGNVRVALYTNGASKPNTLLVESASVAMAAEAGWQDIAVSPYYVSAIGTYWLAIQATAARTTYSSEQTISYYLKAYAAFDATWSAGSTQASGSAWNMRITYSQIKGYIKLTKATLTENSYSITSMAFYSHATGNFYAGIYTDVSGPAVLNWTSGSIAAIDDDWKTVDIADGTPNTLALAAGDYWLAWQWDSVNAGPSYTLGGANTGAYLAQAYGAFPNPMTGETLSTENWSLYVTYAILTLSGVTRDSAGVVLGSCTVWLFKTSDKSYVAATTSDVSTGVYSFILLEDTAYFVRAFKDGSPNVFGVTDDDLVGA